MRALVWVFALLVAAATPAVADDENPFRNRAYDKAPGPMVYPAGKEPDWLPRMLNKLYAPRAPRFLKEYLLFRNASGPTYLVTTWGAAETGTSFLEIHHIQNRESADPAAVFVYGLSVGGISFIVPTGHDVFGDGVATLFIDVAAGGSLIVADGVRIIRLGDKPKDITPKRYGNITNAGFVPGSDKVLFLLAADMGNLYNYGECGACFVTPKTFLVWRDGGYAPACRDHPDYFRMHMEGWREAYTDDFIEKEPLAFLAPRLGWAWNAAQIGEVDAAVTEMKAAFAKARQRGADWPGWRKDRVIEADEYDAFVSKVERNFLPLLEKARRFSKAACPLTAAQGRIYGANLEILPILGTPLHDVK